MKTDLHEPPQRISLSVSSERSNVNNRTPKKLSVHSDCAGGALHSARPSNRSDASNDFYSELCDFSAKRNSTTDDAPESSFSMRWSYVPYEPIPNFEVTWLSFVAHVLQIVLCIIVGVVVGLSMYAFRALTSALWESWYAVASLDETTGKPLVLIAGVLLTSALAFAVRMRVPECSGDGMSSLKISMALANCPPFYSMVVRFFVSAMFIGLGNPMGIAAPGMHLGAMVSANVYYLGRQMAATVFSFLRDHCPESAKTRISSLSLPGVDPTKFREQELERGMPTAQLVGLVAAWSALFYSPISAVLYAIEEYIDVRVLTITFAHMVVAAISAAFVSFESSTPSYIGANQQFSASGSDDATFADHLLWVAVATIMGFGFGFGGFLFSYAVLYVRERTFVWNFWREEFTPILSGVVTCSALYAAFVITDDKGVWSMGMESLDTTGFQKHSTPLLFYFVFPCGKLLAVAIGLACDSPGGLIFPVLLSGGILGYGIGKIVESIFPSVPLLYELCGCIGASSLMASLTRTPLAATALMYSMARGGSESLMIPLLLAPILACVTASWLQMERLSDLILQQDGIDPFNIALTIDRGVNSQSKRVNALGRGHDRFSDASNSILSGSVFCRESGDTHERRSEVDPPPAAGHKRSYSRDTWDDGQGSQIRWFSPSPSVDGSEAHGKETTFQPSLQSCQTSSLAGSRTFVSVEMKKLSRLISGDSNDSDTGRASGHRDSRSSRQQSEPSIQPRQSKHSVSTNNNRDSKRSHSSSTPEAISPRHAVSIGRRESRESNVESLRSAGIAAARSHRLNSPSPWHTSGEVGRRSAAEGPFAEMLGTLGPTPQENLEEESDGDEYSSDGSLKPERGDRRCFSEQPQYRDQAFAREESVVQAGTVIPFRRHSMEGKDGLMELQKNKEFKGRLKELHNSRKAPAMETFRRGMEQKSDDKHKPYEALLVKRTVGRRASEPKDVDYPSAAEHESHPIEIRPSQGGNGNARTTRSSNKVRVRLWSVIMSKIRVR